MGASRRRASWRTGLPRLAWPPVTDLRAQLIADMNEALAARTANIPGSMAYAVPVGALADAAIATFTDGQGVPRVPAYDAELVAKRVWYGAVSEEQLAVEVAFPQVSTDLSEEPGMVTIRAANPLGGAPAIVVDLPAGDAEEFALTVLSVVAAARTSSSAGDSPGDDDGGADRG